MTLSVHLKVLKWNDMVEAAPYNIAGSLCILLLNNLGKQRKQRYRSRQKGDKFYFPDIVAAGQ
jgi:hypothetical protein